MAWTYSGDPSASGRDAIRFLIGDTDPTDPQLQDAEIDWMLAEHTSSYLAAAHCCQALAAKYARLADKSVGDLSISFSQRQEAYTKMFNRLERLAAVHGTGAPVYAGGISESDKEIDETDTDRVQPAFTVDLMKNRWDRSLTTDTED